MSTKDLNANTGIQNNNLKTDSKIITQQGKITSPRANENRQKVAYEEFVNRNKNKKVNKKKRNKKKNGGPLIGNNGVKANGILASYYELSFIYFG